MSLDNRVDTRVARIEARLTEALAPLDLAVGDDVSGLEVGDQHLVYEGKEDGT
mgnify:CR=1 FL=1